MNSTNASLIYHQADIQSRVESASSTELITLLLDSALTRIDRAKVHIERGEIAKKGEVIGGIIDIVASLDSYLDHDKGGDVSKTLESLYDFAVRRLYEANLKSDVSLLDEVSLLLGEVRAGWVQATKE